MAYFKYLPKLLYSTSNEIPNYKLVSNVLAKSTFITDILNNTSIYYPYDVQEDEKPEDVSYRFYKDVSKYWIVLLSNNIIDPQYDWVLSSRAFNDYINAKYSSLTLTLNPTETYLGDYINGEVVYQGNSIDSSSATATLINYNSTNKTMKIKFPDEVFANSANVSGVTSTQSHKIISVASNNDGYNWAVNTTSHFIVTETKFNSYDQIKTINTHKVSANDYNHSTDTVFDANRTVETNSTESHTLSDGTTLTIQTSSKPINHYDYELELNEAKRHIRIIRPEYIASIETEFIRIMSQ